VIRFYGTHPISENVILAKVAACRSFLDALTEDDLKDFDQDHYGGTEVLDALADMAGPYHQHHVLDVGSGMGGPSRWPDYGRGCRVTGLDITGSWVEAAKRLSQRVRLDHLVDFVQGDAMAVPLPDSCYDELIAKESWLHNGRLLAAADFCVRRQNRSSLPGFASVRHWRPV